MIRLLVTFFLLTTLLPCFANSNIVNVYNWSYFMPHAVIKQFEKKTGIHVNYMEYDNNETLYAKLKADPNIGFDVIVPSSYYVQRMAHEGMLHKLIKAKIPNSKYLNPSLLNKQFDPHNQYSLPYMWGTTGIVVNDRYYNPKQFHYWRDLWKPQYKNQLLIFDDIRETFAIALIKLGYSINETNPQHIKQAYEQLRKLLPNIKLFNVDAEMNIYVDEDANLGMGWNGDIYLAQQENAHLKFIYPKGRFALWIDCIAIPKNAPHLNNALKFINFINQPSIAKQIAVGVGYSSPNLQAIKLLPKKMRADPVLNPSPQQLKRGEVENDVGSANSYYEHYWQLLKLGG